jgi:hypothetical protein
MLFQMRQQAGRVRNQSCAGAGSKPARETPNSNDRSQKNRSPGGGHRRGNSISVSGTVVWLEEEGVWLAQGENGEFPVTDEWRAVAVLRHLLATLGLKTRKILPNNAGGMVARGKTTRRLTLARGLIQGKSSTALFPLN